MVRGGKRYRVLGEENKEWKNLLTAGVDIVVAFQPNFIPPFAKAYHLNWEINTTNSASRVKNKGWFFFFFFATMVLIYLVVQFGYNSSSFDLVERWRCRRKEWQKLNEEKLKDE